MSNTSTHSETSVRSGGSSSHGSSSVNGSSSGGKKNGGMGHRSQGSILGLDKMIDEKRDAKTMSERVVHIEVRTMCII